MTQVTEEPTEPDEDGSRGFRRSGWDVVVLLVLLGMLVVVTFLVVLHYDQDATRAATILGIIVPAFATVGAAAFGIRVAYNSGKAEGHARGSAHVERRVAETRSAVAGAMKSDIEKAHQSVAAAGKASGVVAEIDPSSLEEARVLLARLEGMAAALAPEA